MNCIKCGLPATQYFSHYYGSSYCEKCNEISVKRYKQRTKWAAYHDEPCPEIELAQFPKPKLMEN